MTSDADLAAIAHDLGHPPVPGRTPERCCQPLDLYPERIRYWHERATSDPLTRSAIAAVRTLTERLERVEGQRDRLAAALSGLVDAVAHVAAVSTEAEDEAAEALAAWQATLPTADDVRGILSDARAALARDRGPTT